MEKLNIEYNKNNQTFNNYQYLIEYAKDKVC